MSLSSPDLGKIAKNAIQSTWYFLGCPDNISFTNVRDYIEKNKIAPQGVSPERLTAIAFQELQNEVSGS
jgi:hypothetical protein